ncbi:hypothetical protein HYPSUDRAFT_37726 [Hypholoma sublateritium FD-334 SS-4]|uniref:P-loop containing nucleoside triphosphate hydrolase protein n=1 Tax=Hypholoma sublateritium (strain FD-334 SS-4) TaxID=945553 RepID=A0A0D2P2V8_HYPSF|nr:hypothetical protein HYPSUDRAFT_37726 [Hypholoma sublateritium FD-334 SS-4]
MDLISWATQKPHELGWRLAASANEWQFKIARDTLVIPFGLALSLTVFHVIYVLVLTHRHGSYHQTDTPIFASRSASGISFQEIRARAKGHGGWTIYAFAVGRLIGCILLFALSVTTLRRRISLESIVAPPARVIMQYPETFMVLTYLYSSVCSLAGVVMIKPPRVAAHCNSLVLFVAFGVYLYRDLWPLATYSEFPKDANEGLLLWAKLVVLFITAVLIPLFVPNIYVPMDPKDPMPVPNAEQTCSLFSFITYGYIGSIIRLSGQMDHLDAEKLPPLCDTDTAKNLVNKSFPHMDPFQKAKSQHIFFGLMRALRTEYICMALTIAVACTAEFAPAICIYQILNYLEHGPSDSNIRPWFWVLFFFLGPTIHTIFWEAYIFLSTRVLVRTEAILTELVFEHSLRVRFTAEPMNDDKTDTNQDRDHITVVDSLDNSSEAPAPSNSDADSDTTATMTSTTGKGKLKIAAPTASPATVPKVISAVPPTKNPTKGNLVGKINNFVTTDLNNIIRAKDFFFLVINLPIQVTLCMVFLYKLLGWSSFVGLACMIALLPAPGYAARLIQNFQKRKMEKTDARIQIVAEVVAVLRMVKLFGWERKMLSKIQTTRDEELISIWWLKVLQSFLGAINSIIPTVAMLATYATYAGIMRKELTPSVIFSSLTVFGLLRDQLYITSSQIARATQAKVSLDRINAFLKESELLDVYIDSGAKTEAPPENSSSFNKDLVGFKNASFVWSLDSAEGHVTPSRRFYRLHIRGELFFKPNRVNLIIGPTGSGKTSMLMALLGEMHYLPESIDSWFNLPREEGVAYAAQESWVQNETIRSNILFGSPYDETRYKKVLTQCDLDKDLELFEAGDDTEVGEKGITLSGGQKARLTLARAIYSPAKTILLDDILAALDVHTSKTIVEKCLQGDLVKGRTIILVTHNITLAFPIASFIVTIGQDGTITGQDNDIGKSMSSNPVLVEAVHREAEESEISVQKIPLLAKKETPIDGKLILKEEITHGRVDWKSLELFFSALGGGHSIAFFGIWLSSFVLSCSTNAFTKWFLGYWGSQYESHDPSEVNVAYYCTLYSLIVLLAILISNMSYIIFVSGTVRSSRTINTLLLESVLGSTLRWLDETPTARIITRFTQDIQSIDSTLPEEFFGLTAQTLYLITSLAVVLIFTPFFVAPALFIAAIGFYLGRLYLKAQLGVTREKSNARSPVLAHFTAAISGIVSVRAYGAQRQFKAESLHRIDKHTRIARITYNLNRWIGVRIDLLGGIFRAGLATYLIYGRPIGASNSGFALNMTTELCRTLLYVVRYFNDFEIQSNSLERIQRYLDIDHEPKATESGKPPAAWPTSGDLIVENLSARYSQNGPVVLHNLSFQIKSGQRVGIVGRTGSGKSSLTLALLRCIITEGTVYYDGIKTSDINLDALRSKVTIIPQTPELISGTLRRNLDPFDQFDDGVLNDALRAAGLFGLQDELGEARIGLDSNIASAGGNLSVGEKQILALARAMVRGSKLLILDEATSAIDHKTDVAIQTALRYKLDPDVTVITVAHRLQTIMDVDKIMVLDEGRIVEFDTPSALLKKDGGLFKLLVDGSANGATLYEAAGITQVTAPSVCSGL